MSDEAAKLLAPVAPELLAPFEPPPGFVFPDWVNGPAPRALPEEFIEQRKRSKRVGAQICYGLAGLCLIGCFSSLTAHAALFFLPLGYLHWFVPGFVVIGLLIRFAPLAMRELPIQDAIHGEPIVVRIEKLARGPKLYVNGAPAAFHYLALISLPGPAGQLDQTIVGSRDLSQLKGTECTYRAGDYVTAFRRGDRIQLYGFTGIDQGEGIVSTTGAPRHPALTVAITLSVIGLVSIAFVLMFATFRYFPFSVNGLLAVPIATGAAIGAVVLGVMIAGGRRQAAAQKTGNLEAARAGNVLEFGAESSLQLAGVSGWFFMIILALGVMLIPAGICCLVAVRLNAGLDRSASHEEPIEGIRCLMTTTNFIFRDYKIEFTRAGKQDSLMMTPQEMLPLLDAERGTIHVRDGAFGWPWIAKVVPRL